MADNDDLLDYEDEEQPEQVVADGTTDGVSKKEVKGTYVSIHSSGFRDFLLKPEILRAIVDCGFEHPSEGIFKSIFLSNFVILTNVFRYSSTRMHSTGRFGHGYSVPGKVWYGKNCSFRVGHSTTARTVRKSSLRVSYVPYA